MTQLRCVTCHMGSHSVTCYLTQVNTPRLSPSHTGRYLIYLPWRDERLSWPSWLDSAPAGSRTSHLSITSPMLNHCTTKTTIVHYQVVRYSPLVLCITMRNRFLCGCIETLPRWPHMYLEVSSLDGWQRYRTEGYGCLLFPQCPGNLNTLNLLYVTLSCM